MAQQGDDCYFYYYSSCTKGSMCPFRHCEAALGNETVCSLWRAGSCTRMFCKFRHMEIDKKRSAIPCYWENQPGGCKKPHCAFMHYKARSDQRQVADQSGTSTPPTEDSTKTDVVASMPSIERKVEPVVVTFEEESDQESGSGSPVKRGNTVQKSLTPIKATGPKIISTKKSTEPVEDLQVGVKSLEELKEERLLAAAKKQLADAAKLASRELTLTDDLLGEEEAEVQQPSRRIVISSSSGENTAKLPKEDRRIPVKNRLNNIQSIESSSPKKLPIKSRLGGGLGLSSVKSRLGAKTEWDQNQDVEVTEEETDSSEPVDIRPTVQLTKNKIAIKENEDEDDPLSRIQIKSLVQIKRERMMQQGSKGDTASDDTKDDLSKIQVKSLAEIKREKLLNRLGGNEQESENDSLDKVKVKSLAEIRRERHQQQCCDAEQEDSLSKIKVKTLAEIQREKRSQQTGNEDDDLSKIKVKSLDEIRKEKEQKRQQNGQEIPIKRKITSGRKLSEENVLPKKSQANFTVKALGSFARKSKIAPEIPAEENEDDPEETEGCLEELKKKVLSKQEEKQTEKAGPASRAARKKAPKREIQIYRPPRSKITEDVKRKAPSEEETPEEKVKQEKPSPPKVKKATKDWGVKTFSQIMAEKRAAQQERRKAQEEAVDSSSRSPVKTSRLNSIWSNRGGSGTDSKPAAPSISKPAIKPIVFDEEASGSGVVSTSSDKGPRGGANQTEAGAGRGATKQTGQVVSRSTSDAAAQPQQPTVKRKSSEADSTGALVKKQRTGSTESGRTRRLSLRRSSEASTGSIKAEADSTKEGRTHKDSLDDEFAELLDDDASGSGDILHHDDDALMQELEEFLS